MSERYTIKRGDKWLVPKDQWPEAAEKLALFEDAEELEDVQEYCQAMWNLADAERGNLRPDYARALEKAADKIIQLSTFHATASGAMAEKIDAAIKRGQRLRKEIFDLLDEIDGQLLDDPIFVIREKMEEIFDE